MTRQQKNVGLFITTTTASSKSEREEATTFVGTAAAAEAPLVDAAPFSSWNKYRRVVAWIHRFVSNARSKIKKRGQLTVEELLEAERFIIKEDQKLEKVTPHPADARFAEDVWIERAASGVAELAGDRRSARSGCCSWGLTSAGRGFSVLELALRAVWGRLAASLMPEADGGHRMACCVIEGRAAALSDSERAARRLVSRLVVWR
ncbi:hypothetical protein FJT64_018349 [Amphibalanus amphitrite]|uniref:Uncharacterized protein n=1 Tax=Amphibalanus amphitrite TaxID=1232801 RepID=A0A6A4WVB7_AMPAM|nr:hypothetical protein FJT64_018349 [Amphibalanus amphitrite]